MFKKALLVLGMHRSGTSALAGLLTQSGLDIGNDILSPSHDNPKGFFENRAIVRFNDDLLQEMRGSWDLPFPVEFNTINYDNYDKLRGRFETVLQNEFGTNSKQILIKDPRICKLLPFYNSYFSDNSITPNYIIILRNPLEIVASLHRRNGIARNHSLFMWMSYMFDAEYYSRDYKRLFVEYDDLLEDQQAVLKSVQKRFKLSLKNAEQHDFVDKRLHHHILSDKKENKGPIETIVFKASKLFKKLKNTDNQKAVFKKIDKLRNDFHELLEFFTQPENIPYHKLNQSHHYSELAYDVGRGINQWDVRTKSFKVTNGHFDIKFDLQTQDVIEKFVWKPIVNKICTIRLDEIVIVNPERMLYKLPIKNIKTNGVVQGDIIEFLSNKPEVSLEYSGKIKSVSFKGEMDLVDDEQAFKQSAVSKRQKEYELQVSQLDANNQHLQQQLEDLNRSKDEELANTGNRLNELKHQLDIIGSEKSSLESISEELRDKNAQYKISLMDLEEQFRSKQEEKGQLEESVAQLNEQISSLITDNDELDANLKLELGRMEQLESQIVQLRTQHANTQKDLDSANDIINQYQTEFVDFANLKSQFQEIHLAKNDLEEKVKSFSGIELDNEDNRLIIQQFEHEIIHLKQVVDETESVLSDKETKINELQKSVANLEEQLVSQQSKAEENNEIIADFQSSILDMTTELNDLLSDNAEKDEIIKEFQTAYTHLSNEQKVFESKNIENQSIIEAFQIQMLELESIKASLESNTLENKQLLSDLNESRSIIEQFQTELMNFDVQRSDLKISQEIIEQFQMELLDDDVRKSDLKISQEIIEQFQAELMDFDVHRSDLKINQEIIEELQSGLLDMSKTLESDQLDKLSMIKRISELNDELADTVQTMRKTQSWKSMYKSVLNLSNIASDSSVEQLFNELFKTHHELSEKSSAYESLVTKNNELERVVEQKDGVLNRMKEREELLDTQVLNLVNQMQLLEKDLDSNRNDLSNRISELEAANIEFKTRINAKEALLSEYEEIISDLREESINLKIEAQRYYRDYTVLVQRIKELEQSISYKLGFGFTSPMRFVYDKMSKKPFNQTKTSLFLNLFFTALKNPVAAAKSLKAENVKKLADAVSKESPEEISENFKNLVEEPKEFEFKHQQYNTEYTAVDEETIIKKYRIDKNKLGTVIFVSPHLPDYDTSSGGKRATHMLALLAEKYNVFAFTLGDKPEKYIRKLEELGVRVIMTHKYDKLNKYIEHVDVIIYAWYYTYFDAAELRLKYPNARIILDSVDVHWVREERSIGVLENLTEEIVQLNKAREIKAYQNAEVIWTVTAEDGEAVRKEIPDAVIRVVSNVHDIVKTDFKDPANNNMLFFGGFRHYPNISAINMIVNDLVPKVRQEIPDAQLIIAGSHAPEEIQLLGHREGVDFKGFIEEEELTSLYENTFLVVAPLLAGAGIKGKICESIVHAVPVATNSIGNEGINMINEIEGLISDDMDELSQLIIRAMKRSYNLNEMVQGAQKKLISLVGSETVQRSMELSIYPEISICIVTWNRLELVKRCIESIEGNTIYPNYKILVHSNGCEDGTQDYLKAAAELNDKIIPILSPDNEVFVLPNNKMMMMFPENDAVLVNNDTYVTKGWLMGLFEAAYKSKKIGISGSKILYPDGTLQEFGSELYANGTGRNIGKWEDASKEEYNVMSEVGYVSGCSMFIKRSTINKIGVFDEQFHPCYCEDSDYCYTAKEHGLVSVVTPESVIYHDEGGTSGTDTSTGFKRYQEINMKKFLAKHRGKNNTIDWDQADN